MVEALICFSIGLSIGLLVSYLIIKKINLTYDYDITTIKEDIVLLNIEVNHLKTNIFPQVSKNYSKQWEKDGSL